MGEKDRQEIGLLRYALIRDAADPGLSRAQRGRLLRAVADREHVGPDGRLVRVGRTTLGRWVRAYRRDRHRICVRQSERRAHAFNTRKEVLIRASFL